MNIPSVLNFVQPNPNVLLEGINMFKKQIKEKSFINNTDCIIINICSNILHYLDNNRNDESEIIYNNFIEYLRQINSETSIISKKLHSYIVNQVSKEYNGLYKDKDGKYHILTKPILERQSNYDVRIITTELCSLLLDIKDYLRCEFLYREFYLDYIIKEYADVKHQIIKLELTRYKTELNPKTSTTMVILLDVLQLRYFKLTNDISWMLNSIKNIGYKPSSLFYERYMFNINIPSRLHNLNYYPSDFQNDRRLCELSIPST